MYVPKVELALLNDSGKEFVKVDISFLFDESKV
jgi:hypothetical protein